MGKPGDETIESIGPYSFIQRSAGHRLTSDTVLLAEFAMPSVTDGSSVMDLGTGTGALPLILAWKSRAALIVGLEIDPVSADAARRNFAANALSGRVEAVEADYRDVERAFAPGSFDVVLSNPPYTRAGAGRLSPEKDRAGARAELHGTLADLVAASAYLVSVSGSVFFVFRASRMAEMIEELGRAGLKVRRIRLSGAGKGKAASLFLIEAGKGAGARIEPSGSQAL